jgi:hypothetical protein
MIAELWYQELAGLVWRAEKRGQARRERKEWKKCEFEDIIGEIPKKRMHVEQSRDAESGEVGSLFSWLTSHPGHFKVLDCPAN